jgi:NADPH:quinone reductase-like Zn-dependent oxidoreductase
LNPWDRAYPACSGARIGELLDGGQLRTNLGEVLPLSEARLAHEMLAGKSHKPGKIVLAVSA